MKIIHTSDWHLGRLLYGKKRTAEHEGFLKWLQETIQKHHVDALVISGDIFDTNTPSNRAQSMYYRFLLDVQKSGCRHVVIVAGNHDSPSFLDAPKALLGALNVRVVGTASATPKDETFCLKDKEGSTEAIVCAVPYLRDRDLRTGQENLGFEERQQQVAAAIAAHYNGVLQEALACQPSKAPEGTSEEDAPPRDAPIIATGHLFTNGAKTVEGDGVRDLYVGNLAHVTEDAFSSSFDYVALGHLHLPQKVGGKDRIRYCGSPIPMGFGEAAQQKEVVLVEFSTPAGNGAPPITVHTQSLKIPCFQRLEKIVGDMAVIESRIGELNEQRQSVWLEIEYSGNSLVPDLKERIDALVADTPLEVLRIKNRLVLNYILERIEENEELCDIGESDVFARCLEGYQVPKAERPELVELHNEVLRSVLEKDERES